VLKKLTISLIILSFVFWSCSDDGPTWPGPDNTAPSAITDLAVGDSTTTSLKLTWTAPGDDGNVGKATYYEIRYSDDSIPDLTTFESVPLASNIPSPNSVGCAESLIVDNLIPNTKYYFAIRVYDEVSNQSPLSNVPSCYTGNDTIPPATITDLSVLDSAISYVTLQWTSPGGDGDSGIVYQYQIKYDTVAITDVNWDSAMLYSCEHTIDSAGVIDTLKVSGLNSGTTYYFAIKSSDELNNLSEISNVVSATTRSLTAIDSLHVIDSLTTTTSITLSWLSPGDDSIFTQAYAYDIRYMPGLVDTVGFIWDSAYQCTNEPTPAISGTSETFTVEGLAHDSTYTFAVKTMDTLGNLSPISNLYTDSTLWSRFTAPANVEVGDIPKSIISADINDDTYNDLIITNGGSDNVSILFNSGSCSGINTFDPVTNFAANEFPISVCAAELSGDTYLDLAIANNYPCPIGDSELYCITILINNGVGGFGIAISYATGSTGDPSSIVSADFNGDGFNDLAVGDYHNDSVLILYNDSGGVFSNSIDRDCYVVGGGPWSIVTADFDGDGDYDLASANLYSNDVSILINDNNSTFDTTVNYSVGTQPLALIAADFDSDGNVDLATANSGSDNVSVLLGIGDGTFQGAANYSTGYQPNSLYFGDFNNDTYNDIATTNYSTKDLSVLLNDGLGAFPDSLKTSYAAGSDPQAITAGDFDCDGIDDIATANPAADSVSVLINETQ